MNYHTNNVTENRFYSTVKPGWKLPGILALLVAIGFAGCDQITSTHDGSESSPYSEGESGELSSVQGSATLDSLGNELTAQDLAENIAGNGIQNISNVEFTGDPRAAGTFEFTEDHDVTGLSTGVILSTGEIVDVEGAHVEQVSTGFERDGDPDLSSLVGGTTTFDAAVLEFDFDVPADAQTISIEYVYGSDDYDAFVNTDFADVMGIFIKQDDENDWVNCATVGDNDDPVGTNTINNDSNSSKFTDNTKGQLFTAMNGFTDILTCEAAVDADQTYSIKLAIADVGNDIIDSWAYFGENSFQSDAGFEDEPDVTEGCGPGFWKNSAVAQGIWSDDDDVFGPSDKAGDVFDLAVDEDNPTLKESLEGGGGPGLDGAQTIMLRAATAALLNAQNDDVAYEISSAQDVITKVNAAFGTEERSTILELAETLDEFNNQGCPL